MTDLDDFKERFENRFNRLLVATYFYYPDGVHNSITFISVNVVYYGSDPTNDPNRYYEGTTNDNKIVFTDWPHFNERYGGGRLPSYEEVKNLYHERKIQELMNDNP